jgi:hypothetical protein
MASRTTSFRVAYWPETTACFIHYSISGADIERCLCTCSLMASRIASLWVAYWPEATACRMCASISGGRFIVVGGDRRLGRWMCFARASRIS